MIRSTRTPGRLLSWTALLVALGASVAANVAYARAGTGPRLSAGTAPVLVVLAAGLLERVPLARARWWQRWLAIGGLVLIVAAAFVTSFQHQYALLLAYGNPKLSAVLLPFAIDALIVMSSVCLAVIAERRRAGQPSADALPADDVTSAGPGRADARADGPPHGRADGRAYAREYGRADGPAYECADGRADAGELVGATRALTSGVSDSVPAVEAALPRARTRVRAPASPDGRAAGRTVRAELAEQGRALTRDELVAGLRTAGHTVSNARASALLAALNSDTESDDDSQPAEAPAAA